ncbi:MAG: D-alanyl-D-alanine carboxypeptidase [Alphaproteobacteria bacterium]|nr:D-alanyl-D-alanine carboxypeptidase [Alphaproteobacteria bacterium]
MSKKRWLGSWGAAAILATSVLAQPAVAQPVNEAIVLDAQTGQVLRELNADIPTPPASLTKMMTLYLTFEALNQGRLRLDQYMRVSDYAASRAPSKLGLVPGESVTVHDLILGIVTKSANDAATTLAEGLGGSEQAFAQQMNWKARQLGMSSTYYDNASGLPDPFQRSTARDLARLALALYHQFPREYRYFATRAFFFRGQEMRNHNHMLDWYPGLDGIKTGYVNASGFNLAASAVQNGHRLIGVVMGGQSSGWRDRQMAALLDQGFADIGNGQAASRPVMAGAQPSASSHPAQTQAPVFATTPSAAPAAPVAAAAAQANAAPVVATAGPQGDAGGQAARSSGAIGTALRHLAPVSQAEAAAVARETRDDEWSIQLGAFKAESGAEQALRHVAAVGSLRGKPHEVVVPGKGDPNRLYRAVLTHFTQKGAQTACGELHKKGIACSIVRPGTLKVASN